MGCAMAIIANTASSTNPITDRRLWTKMDQSRANSRAATCIERRTRTGKLEDLAVISNDIVLMLACLNAKARFQYDVGYVEPQPQEQSHHSDKQHHAQHQWNILNDGGVEQRTPHARPLQRRFDDRQSTEQIRQPDPCPRQNRQDGVGSGMIVPDFW